MRISGRTRRFESALCFCCGLAREGREKEMCTGWIARGMVGRGGMEQEGGGEGFINDLERKHFTTWTRKNGGWIVCDVSFSPAHGDPDGVVTEGKGQEPGTLFSTANKDQRPTERNPPAGHHCFDTLFAMYLRTSCHLDHL